MLRNARFRLREPREFFFSLARSLALSLERRLVIATADGQTIPPLFVPGAHSFQFSERTLRSIPITSKRPRLALIMSIFHPDKTIRPSERTNERKHVDFFFPPPASKLQRLELLERAFQYSTHGVLRNRTLSLWAYNASTHFPHHRAIVRTGASSKLGKHAKHTHTHTQAKPPPASNVNLI